MVVRENYLFYHIPVNFFQNGHKLCSRYRSIIHNNTYNIHVYMYSIYMRTNSKQYSPAGNYFRLFKRRKSKLNFLVLSTYRYWYYIVLTYIYMVCVRETMETIFFYRIDFDYRNVRLYLYSTN